jgi:hypothetical protein
MQRLNAKTCKRKDIATNPPRTTGNCSRLRILYHSICEDAFLNSLCARAAELRIDLGWMYDGKDDHDKEHEQCVEDIQEHFM